MTTDFVENMRAGAPDVMGTDSTRPVGTPASGTQALLGEMRLTQDSLRTLAESTGGFAAVDTNSFDEAFSRITDANSRYYLLGYAPPVHPRNGRFHHIEVRVKRPGFQVVARRGYPSPSGKTARTQAGCARAMGQRSAVGRLERHLDRAARRAQQRGAAAGPYALRAGGPVQEHGEGGIRCDDRRTRRCRARTGAAAERPLRRYARGLVLRLE